MGDRLRGIEKALKRRNSQKKINSPFFGVLNLSRLAKVEKSLKPCPHCGAEMKKLSDLVRHICQKERSIELDCPPGYPRPGDLIEGVIKDLGLPWPKEPTMMFFGNWKWEWPEVDWEEWKKKQPIIKERVQALFKAGTIRYGSW